MIEITMSERQQEYLRAFMQPRIVGLGRAVKEMGATAPEREAQELYSIVMGPMQEAEPGESQESPEDESSEEPLEKEEDPSEDSPNFDPPLGGFDGPPGEDPEEVPADPITLTEDPEPEPPTPAEEEDDSLKEPGETQEPANVQAGAMQPGTLTSLVEGVGEGGHGKPPKPKSGSRARQGMATTETLKDAAS